MTLKLRQNVIFRSYVYGAGDYFPDRDRLPPGSRDAFFQRSHHHPTHFMNGRNGSGQRTDWFGENQLSFDCGRRFHRFTKPSGLFPVAVHGRPNEGELRGARLPFIVPSMHEYLLRLFRWKERERETGAETSGGPDLKVCDL